MTRPGQGDVQQPPLLGVGEGLGLGHDESEEAVVLPLSGESAGARVAPQHEDVVSLLTLGAMAGEELDRQRASEL